MPFVGISYKAVVQLRLTREKISEGRSGGHAESEYVGSSRESTWRERRHKRCKDRERKREEEQSGLGEGSYQTHRTIPSALGHRQFDERDQELKCLCRLVRDLELEARGRRQRRDRNDREMRDGSEGIDVGRDPTSPVPIHAGIVPIHKNHVDVGTTPVHKNHVDAGTVPIPENHVVIATIPILKSRVDVETIHIHADMLTGVQIL